MSLHDYDKNIQPKLIPLLLVFPLYAAVVFVLCWAATQSLLPEQWAGWTDISLMPGYALLLVGTPILLIDLFTLWRRDSAARKADDPADWVQAGMEAIDREVPYHQPLSVMEAKTQNFRDFLASKLIRRWSVVYVLAVMTCVVALILSSMMQDGSLPATERYFPVFVTAGIAVWMIALTFVCHLCGNAMWGTWERLVVKLQAENPHYEHVDRVEAPETHQQAAEIAQDVAPPPPAPPKPKPQFDDDLDDMGDAADDSWGPATTPPQKPTTQSTAPVNPAPEESWENKETAGGWASVDNTIEDDDDAWGAAGEDNYDV